MRPSQRRSLVVGLLVGVVLTAVATVLIAASGGSNSTLKIDGPAASTAPAPSDGQRQVPTNTFERFDGSTGRFSDYAGASLVVNFWSSTCVPCVKEMPALESVFKASDVKFLGIDVNDTLADGRDFATKRGVTYDLARDPQAEMLPSFGATILPITAFVSARGEILYVHSGALTADVLTTKIATLFG